jgi:nitric oxide synthase oxygenase domain/subunit
MIIPLDFKSEELAAKLFALIDMDPAVLHEI